jgi:AraC-like DNA-binding protein
VKALKNAGHDPARVFTEAGMDYEKINDPNARYEYESITKLWRIASAVADDPCFGLVAASFWHPTTMHALGFAWMASSSLKDAFKRSVRYSRMLNTVLIMRLEEKEEAYEFNIDIDPGHPRPADEASDAGLAIILLMCRMSYDESLAPVKVYMSRAINECDQRYRDYFRAPIEYSSEKTGLVFDKHVIEKQLPTGNADLALSNDRLISEYLARLDHEDIEMQVRVKLIELLPSGEANEEKIAVQLNLSQRTLQRKLREVGTNYKNILEQTRRELATQYMSSSLLTISEVTYLLGFSETSNFSRAFKRWNGVSPSTYRLAS